MSFQDIPSLAKNATAYDRSLHNALMIQEGACNPRGIARTLVEAIDAAYEGPNAKPGMSPAVRLILHQLCYILWKTDPYQTFSLKDSDGKHRWNVFGECEDSYGDWDRDMEDCRRALQAALRAEEVTGEPATVTATPAE